MAEAVVTSSNGNAPLLPPCRVCGERASGFHYGANTCEACKGFFRRSLARKADYRCAGSENCEIQPGRRSICASCRYQKCLAVGMSKEAIKTGRYTHEKKTRDIEEVKRLQRREAVQNTKRGIQSPEDREAELEKIIKHITAAHLQQTPHSPDFFQKLPQREAEYLEKRALQEEMFGTMKPIPREEYQQIYQSTGIDIDGRREMISQMIPCIEKAIKRFIAFAKALPGFKELPIEDQISLIKASRYDIWVLTHFRSFNVKELLYTSPEDTQRETIDIGEWSCIVSQEYLKDLFRLVERMQDLHMEEQEVALLKAFSIFSPDRCQTSEGAKKVERRQNEIIDCLEILFLRNHPNQRMLVPNTISIITQLRTMEHIQRREIEQTFNDFQTLEFPTLFFELMNVL